MKKKDIIKDALLTAKDVERAAKRNAKNVLIEAFAPRLVDVIRQTLNEEGPGPQLASPVRALAKGEEEETESSDVQNSSTDSGYPVKNVKPTQGDHELKGTGGKSKLDLPAPKPGTMTEEEEIEDDDLELEGQDPDMDDLEGDAGDSSFDSVDESDDGDEDDEFQLPENDEIDMEDDDELELESDDMDMDDLEGDDDLELESDDMDADDELGQEPDAEDDVFEAEDDAPEGDEELDLPDELFDDEEDVAADSESGDLESGDAPVEPAPEDDVEEDEELGFDVEDDEADMGNDMGNAEEEFEEGLYLRREDQFQQVDPAEALQSKIDDLEEERQKLANAVGFLKGQLGEVNLFNTKLAHLVKLYESGLFSSPEKRRIAERLDACKSTKQVKAIYTKIVNEVSNRTVLDDIHDVITESRIRRNTKPTGETVYESDEIRKMRRLAGLES